jgi:hypothetical protein
MPTAFSGYRLTRAGALQTLDEPNDGEPALSSTAINDGGPRLSFLTTIARWLLGGGFHRLRTQPLRWSPRPRRVGTNLPSGSRAVGLSDRGWVPGRGRELCRRTAGSAGRVATCLHVLPLRVDPSRAGSARGWEPRRGARGRVRRPSGPCPDGGGAPPGRAVRGRSSTGSGRMTSVVIPRHVRPIVEAEPAVRANSRVTRTADATSRYFRMSSLLPYRTDEYLSPGPTVPESDSSATGPNRLPRVANSFCHRRLDRPCSDWHVHSLSCPSMRRAPRGERQ